MADKADTVFFTDNHMVAQLYEIDVKDLRAQLSNDKDALRRLWKVILPSALLMLHKEGELELPKALTKLQWKDAWSVLNQYTELKVLSINDEITLKNGGFLIQGSLEQII